MKKIYHLIMLTLFLLILPIYYPSIEGEQVKVAWLKIEGYISPATVEYIKINLVENVQDYEIFLITLDTLGGQADATLEIIKLIQASEKPVICLVYPEGADAMSAGTYILMACRIAGMAPYTQIGAGQPVVEGVPSNDTKLINFLSEKIASLAKMNNRNETAARLFVTKNLVLGPEEALKNNVIEVVARSPREFLEKIDGWEITIRDGVVKLNTRGSMLIEVDKPFRIIFMEFFSNPLISSILLGVGILVLILGFTSPGWGAEVAGGILILLGLIGHGFDVNLIGLLLVGIGGALLMYEVFSQTFGAAAVGGILSLSMGIVLMAGSPPRQQFVSQLWFNELISTVSIAMIIISIFFGFLIYKAIKTIRSKPYLEEIPAEYGRAVDLLTPRAIGYVRLGGELWKARSEKEVKPGEMIRVIKKVGDVLLVEPVEEEK